MSISILKAQKLYSLSLRVKIHFIMMKTFVVKLIWYHYLIVPGHMTRMKSGSLSHFYSSNSKYTVYLVTNNCSEQF